MTHTRQTARVEDFYRAQAENPQMVYRYQKEDFPAEELAALWKHSSCDVIMKALAVAEVCGRMWARGDDWKYCQMLSAVYNAGRIEGIRAERARKKAKCA